MANGGCAAVRWNKLMAQQKAQTERAVEGDMCVAIIMPLQLECTVLDPGCLLAGRQQVKAKRPVTHSQSVLQIFKNTSKTQKWGGIYSVRRAAVLWYRSMTGLLVPGFRNTAEGDRTVCAIASKQKG